MGRKRKLINEDIFNMETKEFTITYNNLFKLLDKYPISQQDFCDLAKISPSTLQRMKENKYVNNKTHKKVIEALNKVNPNKDHQIGDIILCVY